MPQLETGKAGISYEVAGAGDPVLLIHGFAATAQDNWGRTGWIHALNRAGRQVITFDLRGHGESEKFYDPADYAIDKLAGDALALLDHLKIARSDVVGFSMGAGIAAELAARHGERFGSVVLAGAGGGSGQSLGRGDILGVALETEDPETIDDSTARGFRLFAEGLGQDRRALAACSRAPRENRADPALIKNPVLVIAGARDDLAGDPAELAIRIRGAKSECIPGVDHMYALANPMFKGAVIDFLTGWA